MRKNQARQSLRHHQAPAGTGLRSLQDLVADRAHAQGQEVAGAGQIPHQPVHYARSGLRRRGRGVVQDPCGDGCRIRDARGTVCPRRRDLHRLEHRHPVDRRIYHRRVITASASHPAHLGTPAVVEAEDRRTPKSLKRGQQSSTAKGTKGTFLPFMSNEDCIT